MITDCFFEIHIKRFLVQTEKNGGYVKYAFILCVNKLQIFKL